MDDGSHVESANFGRSCTPREQTVRVRPGRLQHWSHVHAPHESA
jgi:hypothetical protein